MVEFKVLTNADTTKITDLILDASLAWRGTESAPWQDEPYRKAVVTLLSHFDDLLAARDTEVAELRTRLKLIEQRFDRYCRDGLELGGFNHLPLGAPEAQRLLFDALTQAIKDA
jgi:hypothetical protein